MVTCGKSKLFLFLVAEFDYNMVTSGKDGIYIGTLRDCLLGNAVDVRWKYTKKTFEEGLKKSRGGIIRITYNKKNGSHFIMIKKVKKKYRCYNVEGGNRSYIEKSSINSLLKSVNAAYGGGLVVK